MPSSIWLLRFGCEDFIFSKKFYKVHSIEVLSDDPNQQKEFYHIYNYKYGVKIWAMCAQLDLEVIAKDPKVRKDHMIFINFNIKKFTIGNSLKKKTLIFECYNLLDHKEWGVAIFWGWFSTS